MGLSGLSRQVGLNNIKTDNTKLINQLSPIADSSLKNETYPENDSTIELR